MTAKMFHGRSEFTDKLDITEKQKDNVKANISILDVLYFLSIKRFIEKILILKVLSRVFDASGV